MELHSLQRIQEKQKRRLGQGHGSGRVKTSGRGTKGKKARGKVALAFEGGALPLVKRMPFLRGKGRNRSLQEKPVIVNLTALQVLPANATVDIATLVKYHIIDEGEAKRAAVKILGKGEIHSPLTIALPISKSAAMQIEKAGGTIQKAA